MEIVEKIYISHKKLIELLRSGKLSFCSNYTDYELVVDDDQ